MPRCCGLELPGEGLEAARSQPHLQGVGADHDALNEQPHQPLLTPVTGTYLFGANTDAQQQAVHPASHAVAGTTTEVGGSLIGVSLASSVKGIIALSKGFGAKVDAANGSASNVAHYERQKAEYAAQEINDANPVGSALKDDPYHRSPSYVVNQIPQDGRHFTLRGGDGKQYNLTQKEGIVDGKSGVFEWIVDSKGDLTHQRFIPGGRITGSPNQVPPKPGK